MLSRNPAVEQSVGRKINLQVGSGSVLKCFIDNVWRGDGITPERGGRLLLDLVDLALYDAASTSTAHLTVRQRRLPDVIDFIKSNLEDPSLSTGTIANHFGLSERCVQLLFSDMQTTPSRYIRGLKLERVASLLLLSQYPITNLAYDFGFGDYSQFCRDFKLRFGLSPSNYRCKSA